MATKAKNPQDKATATALKDERARAAAAAMREYEAERLAVLARTARLRAARLAREAELAAKPKDATRGKR